jgi:amino acid transporter
MHEGALSVLTTWSNFYVITGSSAGALTGLMFVVIMLVVGNRMPGKREGIGTFSTPTVVHFCSALLVSAILSAPWRSLVDLSLVLGLTGLCGVAYALLVTYRTQRQSAYEPEVDDWVWYAMLPFVAYVALLLAAIRLPAAPSEAMFALGGAVLLLIFIGIHNAWDIVTYVVVEMQEPKNEDERTTN